MTEYSVLIVDDSDVDRYLLKRLLQKTKIVKNIFESVNGEDAIHFLNEYIENSKKFPDDFPPAIIFLDINMPLMGGFEFLEEFSKLRTQNDYSTSVVMMFTSSELKQDIDTAMGYDFVKSFIVKSQNNHETIKEKILGSMEA